MQDSIVFGIVIVLVSFILLMVYRKIKYKYRIFYIYLILLLLDFIASFIVPAPFEWIIFLIFTIVLIFIFSNKIIVNIFDVEEDKIYIDREPQIWEQFKIPPELKDQNDKSDNIKVNEVLNNEVKK